MILLEGLRPSFTVYLLDDELERLKPVALHLSQAGFNCELYASRAELMAAIPEDPPHIVLFHVQTPGLRPAEFVNGVVSLVPEAHVIALAPAEGLAEAISLYHAGAYECLAFPPASFDQIVRCCDHAAERDYYVYLNEQLKERLQGGQSAPRTGPDFGRFESWLKDLSTRTALGDLIETYIGEVSRYLNGAPVLFFKYIAAYHSLVPVQSVGVPTERWRGLGINLVEVEPAFHPQKLHQPRALTSLKELVTGVLGPGAFTATTVSTSEGVKGILVVAGSHDTQLTEDAYLKTCTQVFRDGIERLALEKRIHTVNTNDALTNVLNRQSFLRKLAEEISRARRISLPVSLLILSIDDPSRQGVLPDTPEMDLLLKMTASVIRKNSRINDLIGRLGTMEFGVLLPHTGRRGAAIKAERLRRIIESADFSKVLTTDPRVTASIGVSEYPTLCQDADELLQTSDEALYEVKRTGFNKVCLAAAPEGFVPDFVVERT